MYRKLLDIIIIEQKITHKFVCRAVCGRFGEQFAEDVVECQQEVTLSFETQSYVRSGMKTIDC